MIGWIRPLRREFWRVMPGWRRVHRFMSTQALMLGSTCLTVFIAVGFPKWVLLLTLALTTLATIYGALVPQPELDE